MEVVLSRLEAREVDRRAVEEFGVSGLLLMENAGAGVARHLVGSFPQSLNFVLVVGGTGQNGGDAWVVARHLYSQGIRTKAVLLGDAASLQGDAAPNWRSLLSMGISTEEIREEDGLATFEALLPQASLLVDGIFGTGLNRNITGFLASCVDAMNQSNLPVVSLDVPSGVCSDSGQILGVAVRATCCCTFVAPKRGLLVWPGADYCGRLHRVSIGVPRPSPSEVGARYFSASDIPKALSQRLGNTHKGHTGKVLLVAGSSGKEGAAILSALGALRGGAGLVSLLGFGVVSRATAYPEIMAQDLPAPQPVNAHQLLAVCQEAAQKTKSVVLGPGLGLNKTVEDLVWSLLQDIEVPVVIDADALQCIAARGLSALRKTKATCFLTPHPGEAATLLGLSVPEVEANRYAAATRLAQESGQTVILKGAGTLIAKEGQPTLVASGEAPLLAVGGTGDVLAGLLGALLADASQAKDTITCALGVRAHCEAAMQLARDTEHSLSRGILASEIAAQLPTVLRGQVGSG